jgi:hypothetical protein
MQYKKTPLRNNARQHYSLDKAFTTAGEVWFGGYPSSCLAGGTFWYEF